MKYTKDNIINTFLNIVSIKDIETISVQDIVSGTKISKSTFYNNFKNINDLLLQTMEKIDYEIFFILENFISNNKNKTNLYNFIGENILPIIYKKKDKIKVMYTKNLKGRWESFLINKYYTLIKYNFNLYEIDYFNIKTANEQKLFILHLLNIINIWLSDTYIIHYDNFKETFYNLCK